MQFKEYHELTDLQKTRAVTKLTKEIKDFYNKIDPSIPRSLIEKEIVNSISEQRFLVLNNEVTFMFHMYKNKL